MSDESTGTSVLDVAEEARPPAPSSRPPGGARGVLVVAGLLLALQAGLRGWLGYRGYFFLDDFAFTGQAASHSVTDWSGFLAKPYNSHLMPGAFVEVWVLTKLWPFNFAAVVTLQLVLQFCVGIAFFALLRELFGTRRAILVPFALFLFTPITLPAFLWWAAALNQLPQQLALITALWCQTRYLRTGRTRIGVLGAVATFGGLLFSEKTLLSAPAIAAFTLLWFAQGGPWQRVKTAWRRHWKVWTAYLVVVVPYALYYVIAVPSPGRPITRGADVMDLFGASFGHALDPGLLGGPWSWHHIGFAGGIAAPGPLATLLASAAVVALVAGTVAWYRNAVYGWALTVGYASVTLVLLATSRATFIGPLIGDEYRYVTDVATIAVIAGTYAVLQPASGPWVTPPARLARRRWPSRYATLPAVQDMREVAGHLGGRSVAATLIVLVLVSCGISTVRYDKYWSTNPARGYLQRLQTDLSDAPRDMIVYDATVPAGVAWLLLNPYNRLSKLLAPLPDAPRFLHTGQSTDELVTVDDDGRLRRTHVDGVAAKQGPERTNGCGWRLGADPITVPLDNRTLGWTWILHLGYLSSGRTSTTLRAGLTNARIVLKPGYNELFVQVEGAIADVELGGLPRGVTVCTNDLEVGSPHAIPRTAP